MGDSSEGAKGVGPYGLDPHGEEPSSPPRPARPAREAPRDGDEPSPIKALDVCPNCGSPMGPVDTVVCMRCGFDLKTLKVIKIRTPPPTTTPADQAKPEAEEAEAEGEALSAPGAGDLWLPALLGAASLVLLAIGCMAGFEGLVGGGTETPAGFFLRLGALVKIILRVAILAGCGLGGLAALAHIARTHMGDMKLAAVRMAGIMAILGLAAFISTTSRGLEWTIESIVQGLGYVGLALFFFGLNLRDALTLLGVTVFAVIGLTFASIILAPM